MNYIGVDPGKSGGIAVIGDGEVRIQKLDATERDICNFLSFYGYLGSQPGEDFAYIERVSSRPGQGVSSTFKFGQSYGFLRGVLSAQGIPFEEVTPQKWQKALGCLTKGDKNVSKQKAGQLFPDIKITHAIADALLLAEFCRRVKSGELAGAAR